MKSLVKTKICQIYDVGQNDRASKKKSKNYGQEYIIIFVPHLSLLISKFSHYGFYLVSAASHCGVNSIRIYGITWINMDSLIGCNWHITNRRKPKISAKFDQEWWCKMLCPTKCSHNAYSKDHNPRVDQNSSNVRSIIFTFWWPINLYYRHYHSIGSSGMSET